MHHYRIASIIVAMITLSGSVAISETKIVNREPLITADFPDDTEVAWGDHGPYGVSSDGSRFAVLVQATTQTAGCSAGSVVGCGVVDSLASGSGELAWCEVLATYVATYAAGSLCVSAIAPPGDTGEAFIWSVVVDDAQVFEAVNMPPRAGVERRSDDTWPVLGLCILLLMFFGMIMYTIFFY